MRRLISPVLLVALLTAALFAPIPDAIAGNGDSGCCSCACETAGTFCAPLANCSDIDTLCNELGSGDNCGFNATNSSCSEVPACPGAAPAARAPVAGPTALGAIVLLLGALGAWRARRRA